MASTTKHAEPQPSRWQRALYALPIFGLAILTAYAFTKTEATVPVVAEFLDNGRFEYNGVSVPILKRFYGISLFDELFVNISAAFMQLQTKATDVDLYHNSVLFLTEFVSVYAILLFESSRPANKSTLFQFPSAVMFVAQLVTAGLVGNVFLFSYYIFRSFQSSNAPTRWGLNGALSVAVLPSIAIGYYIPHYFMFFSPSLEARHWWCWLWQLFPVWGGVLVAFFSRATKLSRGATQWLDAPGNSFFVAKLSIGVIALMNFVAHWYVALSSDKHLTELWTPKYFLERPDNFGDGLKVIIQYDYIGTMGGTLLWLLYSLGDLKAADITTPPAKGDVADDSYELAELDTHYTLCTGKSERMGVATAIGGQGPTVVSEPEHVPFKPRGRRREWIREKLDVVPTYLFRVYTSKSNGTTNMSWAKSHEAAHKTSLSKKDIFAWDDDCRVASMVFHHLRYSSGGVDDNLVSWSSSLLYALQYMRLLNSKQKYDWKDIRLMVIDTTRLPRAVFIRDMDLIDAFSQHDSRLMDFASFRRRKHSSLTSFYYFGEYLSQGALQVDGMCCTISARDMIDAGLFQLYPEMQNRMTVATSEWFHEVLRLRDGFTKPMVSRPRAAIHELRAAISVAQLFGASRLPMAANLLGCLPRQVQDDEILLAFKSSSFTDAERELCSPMRTIVVAYDTLPEVQQFEHIRRLIFTDSCLAMIKG
ncbi:hypothetical protein HJFPF1_04023 [Paramyrothecium foliicola]|nr:hypothetical protein HJFPF1_04023 [Paramyrothecium foliicola]